MANFRKFTFDLDFDPPAKAEAKPAEVAADAEPEDPPEPPAPTFSEEELQLARDAAFEQGRQQGYAEAGESVAKKLTDTMTAISRALGSVARAQEEAADANQRTAVRVAMAVLRKVLPAACERHAFDEVTRVVEDCLGQVLDEPRIIVRVAGPLVDMVRERLEAVALDHGFEGRVVVQPDSRLSIGDARVEWADGGAERDQARLLRDIEETVERALAPPEKQGHGE